MPSKTRLSPDIWLIAGLTALATDGPSAVAAEPLARTLGTTKGSFYWHFKDVPAFHAALLRHWQATALAQVMSLLQSDATPDQTLRDFGHNVLADPVEPALRTWARDSAHVSETLAEVDAERLACITRLLTQMDLRNPDFAHALIATLIGLGQMQLETPQTAFDALVDTVLALRS